MKAAGLMMLAGDPHTAFPREPSPMPRLMVVHPEVGVLVVMQVAHPAVQFDPRVSPALVHVTLLEKVEFTSASQLAPLRAT